MGCQSIFNFILYCEHFYVSQFIININQLHSTSLTSLCFFFTFLVLIPNFLSIPLHISCWSVAVNTTHYKSPVLPFLMENVPAKDSLFSVPILSSCPPVFRFRDTFSFIGLFPCTLVICTWSNISSFYNSSVNRTLLLKFCEQG